MLDLFGSFTSIGYLTPDHPNNQRAIGLTGGSWELGVIFSLCYFIIIRFEKISSVRKIIYFAIVLLVNIFSENRMNAIGFVIANIILLKQYVGLRNYLFIITSLFLVALIAFLNLEAIGSDALDRLAGTNYLDALNLVRDFYVFSEIPPRDDLDTSLWSLWYRLNLWSKLLVHYISNFFTIVFGAGVYRVYFFLL